MFTPKCGGIKLNEDVFKEINGVITLSTESEIHNPVTSCGQLWDSNIFSVGKVEDKYIISIAARNEEIHLGSLIKTNCSILCDGHYFSVDEGRIKFYRKIPFRSISIGYTWKCYSWM